MADISEPASLFNVDGKVALVTGGSRGIGLYTATAYLKAGAALVLITARSADGVDAAAAALNKLPGIKGRAVGIASDASSVDSITTMLATAGQLAETHAGAGAGIDILVANAGTTWGGPFLDTPDQSTQKVLDLNVRGVFNLVRLAVPLLRRRATAADPARVILISSVTGIGTTLLGEHSTIAYSISKAAVVHLGKNLALELGPSYITTNTVAPGFIPTKLADGLIDVLGGESTLGAMNPRGRLGEPDDIAGVMLFLASKSGAYVNGQAIVLDGGQHLGIHPGVLKAGM